MVYFKRAEFWHRTGYAPQVTGDPEEVPRLIETHTPHLILLDLMLPGTDGIALMARVSAMTDVPVIFLSEPDRSPICRDYACMISSFVRARPWARPQTQTLSC